VVKSADSKIQPVDLILYKSRGEKIVCLTAYDFRTAQIVDSAGIDLILVGDSLANVFAGCNNTYEIGMTEMVYHTKVVSRGIKKALLVADMPFLSFQVSVEEALKNASELLKAGAKAIKLEGATELTLKIVEKLTEIGIPVVGHLGYTPQSAGVLGIGKVQGRTQSSAQDIFEQARSLEMAGAIALVLELIPQELASQITQSLRIPTIGIGAGLGCDGQILVIDDMLGKTDLNLKFVKKYLDLEKEMRRALLAYASDVRSERFPEENNSF